MASSKTIPVDDAFDGSTTAGRDQRNIFNRIFYALNRRQACDTAALDALTPHQDLLLPW